MPGQVTDTRVSQRLCCAVYWRHIRDEIMIPSSPDKPRHSVPVDPSPGQCIFSGTIIHISQNNAEEIIICDNGFVVKSQDGICLRLPVPKKNCVIFLYPDADSNRIRIRLEFTQGQCQENVIVSSICSQDDSRSAYIHATFSDNSLPSDWVLKGTVSWRTVNRLGKHHQREAA
uniref:Uncharacterized protein n=1 Tax=Spongospora subterranea TaxID=70186 RepID=A0A0H5QJ38_9EUKA|eukprot:CRZ01672.1 hypothetical protein [Spongospora subterranea]